MVKGIVIGGHFVSHCLSADNSSKDINISYRIMEEQELFVILERIRYCSALGHTSMGTIDVY